MLEYESGKVSYQQAAQNIERSVRSLFYMLLLLEGRIAIGEESVHIAEERAEDSQIRFDAGLIDEYTLLTAQVNIINTQTPVEEMRKTYRDTIRQFNVLLGNDINQQLELQGNIEPQIFDIDADRVVAELLPLSPSIRSAEIAVDIFRGNRAIQAAGFLPTFTIGYSFSQSFDQDFVRNFGNIANEDNWTTGGGCRSRYPFRWEI